MNKKTVAVPWIVITFLLIVNSHAAIYSFQDYSSGEIHFTDAPPKGKTYKTFADDPLEKARKIASLREPYKDKSTAIGKEIIKLEKLFNNADYLGTKGAVTNCGVYDGSLVPTIECLIYFNGPYSEDYFKHSRDTREKQSIVSRIVYNYAKRGKYSLDISAVYQNNPLCRYQYFYPYMRIYKIFGI